MARNSISKAFGLLLFIFLTQLYTAKVAADNPIDVKENLDAMESRIKHEIGGTQETLFNLLTGGSICGAKDFWRLYDNRKCFITTLGSRSWEFGNQWCKTQSTPNVVAEMLTIDSVEEITWILNFLKGKVGYATNQTHWLRYKKSAGGFTNLSYTSWEDGMPSNNSGHDCLTFSTSGVYRNVVCDSEAKVICQRSPVSLAKVLRPVVQNHTTEPPLGYVYTQYLSQPSPQNLWPNGTWENISGRYSIDEKEEGITLWRRTK